MTLEVHDSFGRTVATLIDHEMYDAGKHVVRFVLSKHHLTSGIYFYSLKDGKKILTRKMVHLEYGQK